MPCLRHRKFPHERRSERLDSPHSPAYFPPMQSRHLVKAFTIGGFVAGEIYMLLAVLAPYRTGAPIPTSALIGKILASALFFGPFGAAIGLGLGLLVSALLPRR